MSYNDLNNIKKINGIPVDLNYFQKVTENDAYLKNIADTDEDLSALDRDIIPITDNAFNIGTSLKRINNAYLRSVVSSILSLSAGTLGAPSLTLGTAALASLSGNNLSYIANGLEPIRFSASGLLVRAANTTQIKLENTLPGSLSTWSIGSNLAGFEISDLTNGTSTKAIFGANDISLFNVLKLINGTQISPSYTFSSDPSTGIYKDPSAAILNFSLSGTKKLELSSAALEIFSDKLIIPALSFTGNPGYGVNFLAGKIGMLLNGATPITFSETGTKIVSQTSMENSQEIYSNTNTINEVLRKAKGTLATPAFLTANTDISIKRFEAYTDTGFKPVAEIGVSSLENFQGAYGTAMYFSTVSEGETEVTEKLQIGAADRASANIPESFGVSRTLINTAGLGQQIDVSGKSKLAIDATLGNIEIKGFIGGKEDQMLYIYKKVPTNTFTLVFNSPTATQKVLLKGSANFVSANDYGGITLTFDEGIWREVCRS